MEITKESLEVKLKQFVENHKTASAELERYTILVRKYEGAIESIQLLLKELGEPNKEKPELKKK